MVVFSPSTLMAYELMLVDGIVIDSSKVGETLKAWGEQPLPLVGLRPTYKLTLGMIRPLLSFKPTGKS